MIIDIVSGELLIVLDLEDDRCRKGSDECTICTATKVEPSHVCVYKAGALYVTFSLLGEKRERLCFLSL